MKKTRKCPPVEEKALVLKKYLVEKVPISDLCDEYGLQPSQIYRWQKQLFENAPVPVLTHVANTHMSTRKSEETHYSAHYLSQ